MSKVNPNFPHDMFSFLHKPLRELDKREGDDFLDRFLFGPQHIFEDTQARIAQLKTLNDPAEIRSDLLKYLKDIVGLTSELENITSGLSDNDLRKLIQLAVPLWKQKGLEIGYKNIIRLFTGKGSRVFNWFDFRWIIGEKSIGSEQLGEDSWLISVPGVEASTPIGDVVLLLTLEGNLNDGSVIRNNATSPTSINFFEPGALGDSVKYLHFDGGTTVLPGGSTVPGNIVVVPYTEAYDFSGDFTIEMFVRSTYAQDAILFSHANGTKTISIRYKSDSNQIIYVLDDGSTQVTETLTPLSDDIDDGVWKHLALIVNRSEDKARLYWDGDNVTAGAALGSLGDLSMPATSMFIGGETFETNLYRGDLDNFRISRSDQYNLTNGSIPVTGATFASYQEEQLDEFRTDIRMVDNGSLDRTLMKRILNLMRPASERLNIIFVDFFEDFTFGRGDLVSIVPGAFVEDGNLVVPNTAREQANPDGSDTWKDIVLQVRQRFSVDGKFSIKFLVQDNTNYYEFVIDRSAETGTLQKVIAGVPTVLDGPTTIPVDPDTFYIWTIITDLNSIEGETLIRTYQDGNTVNEAIDGEFEQGTWGIESLGGATSRISEIEMFQLPLDVETVNPNFDL